jgi:hypothetical protein
VGALASQLGAVTVSSVPDEVTGEVGGLQNTGSNLGASLGTALAGSILIGVLTTTFLSGLESSPEIPDQVAAAAQVELAGGIPFVSDADLEQVLQEANVPEPQATAILEDNEAARIAGLRLSLAVLALLTAVALFFTRLLPTEPVGAAGGTSLPAKRSTPRPRLSRGSPARCGARRAGCPRHGTGWAGRRQQPAPGRRRGRSRGRGSP